MKVGYPCINLSLSCRSSKTFRLKSYSEARLEQTVENNLACLRGILEYNREKGLLFFRITSDLVPFASHAVCTFPWQHRFKGVFQDIGDYIKTHDMRVSMHPDQFVLINSISEEILQRSVAELAYHADVLDLMGVDATAKIQIHVGGAYGDKAKSIRRFIERYKGLPETILKRLVIENDERLFDVGDCLFIHKETKIPVVFDVFHFACNNRGEHLRDAFSQVRATWKKKDGKPIVDYSSQRTKARVGTHTYEIEQGNFEAFLKEMQGFDFDIMCEIKDKEKSALKAASIINTVRRER